MEISNKNRQFTLRSLRTSHLDNPPQHRSNVLCNRDRRIIMKADSLNINDICDLREAVALKVRCVTNVRIFLKKGKLTKAAIPLIEKMFSQFRYVKKVKLLIKSNKIADGDAIFIAHCLKTMKYVRKLDLNMYGNQLLQPGFQSTLYFVKQLKFLESLKFTITKNLFNYQSTTKYLASCLSKLQKIRLLKVNLKYTTLEHSNIVALARAFARMRKLEVFKMNLKKATFLDTSIVDILATLNLWQDLGVLEIKFGGPKSGDQNYPSFTEKEATCLAKMIASKPNLWRVSLVLTRISLNDGGVRILMNVSKTLPQLTEFDIKLADNAMTNVGAFDIAEAISHMKNLTELTCKIEGNRFDDQGAIAIAKSIAPLTTLVTLCLKLKKNFTITPPHTQMITEIGTAELLKSLKNLRNLKYLLLKLEKCSLGEGNMHLLELITNAFAHMKYLSLLRLDLKGFKLDMQEIQTVFAGIRALPSLLNLRLRVFDNALNDEKTGVLTHYLGMMVQLKNLELDLGCNHIKYKGLAYLAVALMKLTKLDNLIVCLQFNEFKFSLRYLLNGLFSFLKHKRNCMLKIRQDTPMNVFESRTILS